MLTSSVWVCGLYERDRVHCGGQCLHESRMREICTSGSTRGEGRCYLVTLLPPLLYRFD